MSIIIIAIAWVSGLLFMETFARKREENIKKAQEKAKANTPSAALRLSLVQAELEKTLQTNELRRQQLEDTAVELTEKVFAIRNRIGLKEISVIDRGMYRVYFRDMVGRLDGSLEVTLHGKTILSKTAKAENWTFHSDLPTLSNFLGYSEKILEKLASILEQKVRDNRVDDRIIEETRIRLGALERLEKSTISA